MKNKTLNKSIITVFAILMGMLFVLSDLAAQEEVRRGLRGGSMSERDPSDSGGADTLGEERAEGGRPDNPFSKNPGGGAGDGEEPEVDDPFANEEGGGAGDGEESGEDDPFMGEDGGGAGDGEESGEDDPFMGEDDGGAGDGEESGEDDPFMGDDGGGGAGGGEEPGDDDPFTGDDGGAGGGGESGGGGDDPDLPDDEGGVCSVILFGRPSCGLCKATKSALNEENIVFTEKNIDTDSGASEEMWEHVQSTGHEGGSIALPVVVANGKVFLNPTDNLSNFITEVKNACKASKK